MASPYGDERDYRYSRTTNDSNLTGGQEKPGERKRSVNGLKRRNNGVKRLKTRRNPSGRITMSKPEKNDPQNELTDFGEISAASSYGYQRGYAPTIDLNLTGGQEKPGLSAQLTSNSFYPSDSQVSNGCTNTIFTGDRVDGGGISGGVSAKVQGGKHTCDSCKRFGKSISQIPVDYASVNGTSENTVGLKLVSYVLLYETDGLFQILVFSCMVRCSFRFSGINDLNKEDQTELENEFIATAVDRKPKRDTILSSTSDNDDVPKAKQSKTEQYSNPMLEQNETREKKVCYHRWSFGIFKFRFRNKVNYFGNKYALKQEVSNDILKELLEHNQQKIVTVESHLIDTVADCMVLQGLEHCPECGGFLIFKPTDDSNLPLFGGTCSSKIDYTVGIVTSSQGSDLFKNQNPIPSLLLSIFKELEDTCRVLKDTETNGIFTTVIGLVGITRGTNSYDKLQLLESDNGLSLEYDQFISLIFLRIIFSSRRTGTIYDGNKVDGCSRKADAINAFHALFDKTGNEWSDRRNFQKLPNKHMDNMVIMIKYKNCLKVRM
ncbi:unnamed protein product [Rotaria magnacalcarata]|uniref:NAD(+) ADP-ribosyltransferase n=1 Tax=Rotaria magnacalcarata TaxID=392030 RepID=A0A8S2N7R8_9BILA|nr:unnamed protein product [Rotaria magnacalcarata]CAF4023674.1 unnamed protein product [Rotaria magnacalcarata]